MGVIVATVRAALNTVTGTQNFTTADCGGLTPKAAKFFLTRGITDGTKADHGAYCIGAADGTRQWCFGGHAEDAVTTTNTDRFFRNDHCVNIQDKTTGGTEGSAVFSAWITNGITINIDDAFPAGYLLAVVFFCGTDLSVYAGTADMGNTINLEIDITAPAFQPDIVFAASTLGTVVTTTQANFFLSYGVAHSSGGVVTQRCVNSRADNGGANVERATRVSTLYGIMSMAADGSVSWGGEFANFDASGFSIITRIAAAGNQDIGYLALDFGGAAAAWVGTVASPAILTGNASITSPGFKPQFVMQGLSMAEAVNTAYATDNGNSFGVGVMTVNAQFCNSLWDDDGAADSNSECISDNIPINIQNGVDGTGLVATFVSFDANGWTVNYSDVEVMAKQSWAVAIQEVAGAAASKFRRTLTPRVGSRG